MKASGRRGVTRAHRARWARTYAETHYANLPWFSTRPDPWLVRAVREGWWRRRGRVLDIGCGAGTNALFLARHGFRTAGVDLADGAIAAARERARLAGLSVDFRVEDVLRLPFPNGYLEAATDFGCFHTLPPPLRSSYAREVARVLRPGGTLAISWVAREYQAQPGPPHRLSLEQVTAALEREFLFLRTQYRARGRSRRSHGPMTVYDARLERRQSPQPPGP